MEASAASKSGRTRRGEVGSVGTKCEFILCVTGGGERTKAGCEAAAWRVRSGHGANAEAHGAGDNWGFCRLGLGLRPFCRSTCLFMGMVPGLSHFSLTNTIFATLGEVSLPFSQF